MCSFQDLYADWSMWSRSNCIRWMHYRDDLDGKLGRGGDDVGVEASFWTDPTDPQIYNLDFSINLISVLILFPAPARGGCLGSRRADLVPHGRGAIFKFSVCRVSV